MKSSIPVLRCSCTHSRQLEFEDKHPEEDDQAGDSWALRFLGRDRPTVQKVLLALPTTPIHSLLNINLDVSHLIKPLSCCTQCELSFCRFQHCWQLQIFATNHQ